MIANPIYTTSQINQSIRLYEGEIALEQTGIKIKGSGYLDLVWLPDPELKFSIEFRNYDPSLELGNATISISSQGCPIKSLLSGIQSSGSSNWVYSGRVNDRVVITEESQIASLQFHIPNFWYFAGTPVNSNNQADPIVSTKDWQLGIYKISTFDKQRLEDLKEIKGYSITHIGCLEKTTGTKFAIEESEDVISALHYFLSFCRGFWTGPILKVGRSEDENPVFNEWSIGRIDPCQTVSSWFNYHSKDGVSQVFPGFFKRWQEKTWRDALRLGLYWYIECNKRSGGMEGAIILAQASFELLAWTLLVKDKQVLSKEGFDKLPASDKLRLLISTCRISLSIPTELENLQKFSRALNCLDGPHVLTEIRNALVHPTPRKRDRVLSAPNYAIFEAWNLSLQYLELVFLCIFNYQGKYSNRLKRECYFDETIELVPWAANS